MELTKKEAIELLKERYITMSMYADKEYCIKHNAAIDMAISSLESDANVEEEYELLIEWLNEKIESLIDELCEQSEIEDETFSEDYEEVEQ